MFLTQNQGSTLFGALIHKVGGMQRKQRDLSKYCCILAETSTTFSPSLGGNSLKISISGESGTFRSSALPNTTNANPSGHRDQLNCTSTAPLCCSPFQTNACSQTPLTFISGSPECNREAGPGRTWPSVGPSPTRSHRKATHTVNALLQQNWDLPTSQLCHCSRAGRSCLSAGPQLPTPSAPRHGHDTQLQLLQWCNTDIKVIYSKSNYKAFSKYCIFEQMPSS